MAMTTLERWSPWTPFGRFPDPFEGPGNGEGPWGPAIDVIRGEDKIVMKVELPGIKLEEVKIEVDNDVLTVSGQHEDKLEETKEHFIRRERRFGSFSRSLALPAGISPDEISATCKDGLLEVTVPLPETPEKKKVTITPKVG